MIYFTQLETLAYISYKERFPFLNMVQNSSQSDLLITLPKFYTDLTENNTDTLNHFVIKLHGIQIKRPQGDLANHIIERMCKKAAEGILLQCRREYGFGPAYAKLRATDLSNLTKEQLDGLPTNN